MSMNLLFNVKKPLIGMVHLLPLAGSLRYGRDDRIIFQRARADAFQLQEAGFHGIMVENFGDAPFHAESVKPHTVSQMTAVISELRSDLDIPVGVNVLRNDAFSALAIARVTGCSFIRVNVLSGVVATDQGFIQGQAAELMAYKQEIGSKAQIFADVHVKHGRPLHTQDIVTAAKELVERGGADAVIVTGQATGAGIEFEELERLRAEANFPLLAGSGISPDNIERYLPLCDGAIIGSCLKKDGCLENPVDPQRAQELVAAWQKLMKQG